MYHRHKFTPFLIGHPDRLCWESSLSTWTGLKFCWQNLKWTCSVRWKMNYFIFLTAAIRGWQLLCACSSILHSGQCSSFVSFVCSRQHSRCLTFKVWRGRTLFQFSGFQKMHVWINLCCQMMFSYRRATQILWAFHEYIFKLENIHTIDRRPQTNLSTNGPC